MLSYHSKKKISIKRTFKNNIWNLMGTLGKYSEDIFLLTGKHPFFPPEDTVFAFMKHNISKIKTCIRLVIVFQAKHTHTHGLSTSSSQCCKRCSLTLSLSLMNGKYDLMVIVVFASCAVRGWRPIAAFRNT